MKRYIVLDKPGYCRVVTRRHKALLAARLLGQATPVLGEEFRDNKTCIGNYYGGIGYCSTHTFYDVRALYNELPQCGRYTVSTGLEHDILEASIK